MINVPDYLRKQAEAVAAVRRDWLHNKECTSVLDNRRPLCIFASDSAFFDIIWLAALKPWSACLHAVPGIYGDLRLRTPLNGQKRWAKTVLAVLRPFATHVRIHQFIKTTAERHSTGYFRAPDAEAIPVRCFCTSFVQRA